LRSYVVLCLLMEALPGISNDLNSKQVPQEISPDHGEQLHPRRKVLLFQGKLQRIAEL